MATMVARTGTNGVRGLAARVVPGKQGDHLGVIASGGRALREVVAETSPRHEGLAGMIVTEQATSPHLAGPEAR